MFQGLTLAIVGPTLLDISEILDISVARMSYVAFSGDFGAFVGSFLGKPLAIKWDLLIKSNTILNFYSQATSSPLSPEFESRLFVN